jgi:CBS domain-containing protein
MIQPSESRGRDLVAGASHADAVLDATGNYIGLITLTDILKHYSESGLFDDAAGVIVLEVGAKSYSMSEIARMIEDENARILSFYITPNAENETIAPQTPASLFTTRSPGQDTNTGGSRSARERARGGELRRYI